MDDKFLGSRAVADFYGITQRSLFNWRKAGRVPEPETLPNGRLGWRESVLRDRHGIARAKDTEAA